MPFFSKGFHKASIMDGYPDPEDEFEMMHAADMEAMDVMDAQGDDDPDDFDFMTGAPKRAKKSLSFVNKTNKTSAPAEADEEMETLLDSSITGMDDQSSRQVPVIAEPTLQRIQDEINNTASSRKRKACTTSEDLFGDIEDIETEEYYSSTLFGNKFSNYFYVSLYFVIFPGDNEKEKDKNIELEEDLLLIARIREERQKILAESSLLPSNEKRSEAYNRFVLLVLKLLQVLILKLPAIKAITFQAESLAIHSSL
jgi:hypothetical protein